MESQEELETGLFSEQSELRSQLKLALTESYQNRFGKLLHI